MGKGVRVLSLIVYALFGVFMIDQGATTLNLLMYAGIATLVIAGWKTDGRSH